MPAGPLEVRCQQTLEDIVIISQRIRSSALRCANNQENDQYLNSIASFRQQLETIRRSAETILEAITLQNRIIDERVFTWLFSGKLHSCLDKLMEIDEVFKLDGLEVRLAATSALPPGPAADNIMRAIALFDNHKDIFYFLLTPEIWNHETQQAHQPDTLLSAEETPRDVQETRVRSSTEKERGHEGSTSQTKADQEAIRQKEFSNQKLDEVTRWLAALECIDKHNGTLKQRQQGTCMWFPNIGAYKVWRSSSSPFLWLHGRGGCGKSVLFASTIEHLESTLEDGDVLVYYYCDFRNERSTSPTEVMRSLLSQLFRHFRDCGVDGGALPNRILEEKRDGTLTLNDLDQIAHLVLRAAGRFPREPMILIDALDECTELEKFLPALSILMHSHIRLLVTSRPLEIFKKHFKKYPSLSFHAMGKELAADIGLHITQELDLHAQLRSADAELKCQVQEKLHEKADGRFRWVQCQLDTLRRCSSRQELQEVLDDLPGGLKETYERILLKIDERTSDAKLVRRALVWLIAALVPLRLTQILDGLSFDPRERRIHCGTQSLGPVLLDALSSLVLYNKETDVLALSHLTVKEYLTSRTALPMYRIIPHEAHIEVTEMCMFYITSLLKQVRFRASLAMCESSPMLSYVFATGLSHLAYVDPASSLVLEVLQSFASEIRCHPSHWDLLCELREEDPRRFYPPWPSSRHDVVLYILIAYSSVALLDLSLSLGRPLRPRPGTNPLVYAVDLWKTTHALSLTGNGVDVTLPGLVVDDSRHALPLEVAIDLGNDVIVGELLRRGSAVTSELLSTAVCMPWCSTRVLVQLVQTDAFTEWAHGIGDEELYRAIFNSARPNAGDSRQADRDHVALARRLRELGQNLAPNSAFGAELVERALNAGHISMLELLLPPGQPPPARFLITACTGNTPETVPVVRFLLHRGVNVRAISRGGMDTALHLVAMSPWEPRALELTKMLLDAGCNPNVQNRSRETPLTIAVRRGYVTVVEHFLSRKTLLPSHILLLALQKRRKYQMIELLLRGGAKVDGCTVRGNTGLHLVILDLKDVQFEHFEDLVDQVIREERLGYDSEHAVSQDDEREQDDEIVDNPQEEDQYEDEEDDEEDESEDEEDEDEDQDVLYGSCEEYREVERLELVKLLVESGSDPNSYSGRGETIVEIAVRCQYTSVVEYFLSCNVLLPSYILEIAMESSSPPKLVKRLVHAGADVHSLTSSGETVLHVAITIQVYDESMCLKLVKIFIEAGCDPLVLDADDATILEVSIQKGYSSVVEHLLTIGVPLPPDILAIALQRGSIGNAEIAAFLVHKGADVHFTTIDGDTVLHLATMHYKESLCLDLVKIFIKGGCSPTSHDTQGRTVLDIAVQKDYISVVEHLLTIGALLPPDILATALQHGSIGNAEIAAFLVHKGADVHFTTIDGDTVLHLATMHYKESLCLDLVKIFIKGGCSPTSHDTQGRTVLDIAIQKDYISVVEHLLTIGVLLPPDILATALQRGLIGNTETAAFLVHKGADVHFTTNGGDTVLHLTTMHYEESLCLNLIKIFIEAGCDPKSRSVRKWTILEHAISRGYASLVEFLLLSVGVPFSPDILITALQHGSIGNTEVAAFLVRKGANVHSLTSSGETVIHLAITIYNESMCLKLVKIFIEAGCDPMRCNSEGKSIWITIMERGYGYVVELLFSFNIPGPPDILLMALWYRLDLRTIDFLICNGANAKLTTAMGDNALHLATAGYWRSCTAVVRRILEAGCNPNSCNSKGKSVLRVAIEKGHASVVELLLSYNVPLPPNILPTALQLRAAPGIIELLICHGAGVHFTSDTLFQIAQTSYDGLLHQCIVGILDIARRAKRVHASLEDDGTPGHVEKRARLEETG